MNILFFAFVYFFLVIIQTCILPYISCLFFCFDLQLIPVILVSVQYQHYAVCICVAFVGLLMDSLSGCAFFTHMFAYIWIYVMIQFLKRLVFLKNFFFILVVAILSVGIEFGMVLFPALISKEQVFDGSFVYARQAIMAMMIVPPMVWALDSLRKHWLAFVKSMQEKWIQIYRN